MKTSALAKLAFYLTISSAIFASTGTASLGAEIKLEKQGISKGVVFISISGTLGEADFITFDKVAEEALKYKDKSVVVILNSLGGEFYNGMAIGLTIHDRGWTTLVTDHTTCASSCANIWLAGKPHLIAEGARVVFHVPFTTEDPEHADGTGAFLFGMYVRSLGYSMVTMMNLIGHGPGDLIKVDNTTGIPQTSN